MRFIALLMLIAIAGVAHAQVPISALPSGTTLAGTEPIPAVQGGATVKTTPADIGLYVANTLSIGSGRYTPTCTSFANISAVSCTLAWTWARVGNTVNVSGYLLVTPTAAGNTSTTVRVTLPVASNFTGNGQGAGACSGLSDAQPAGMNSNSAVDQMDLTFASVTTNQIVMTCVFTYTVQ